MSSLSDSVEQTMNFVFADMKQPKKASDKKKRKATLKANIGKVANLPLNEICTDENIRSTIDKNSDSFLRLVESVKKYGILENIVVEFRPSTKGNEYTLVCIAGHRRLLAAKEAKNIKKVPCLLQAYKNEGDDVGVALAENLNREDLHCLDVAEGYKRLIKAGWSEEEISNHFCRDIRTIRHYLKIAKFSNEVKKILREHPKTFSTRVIMRQFAYKKYNSNKELKESIQNFLAGKPKKTAKKDKPRNVKPMQVKSELHQYLKNQSYLSSLIKEEIEKAFKALNLI